MYKSQEPLTTFWLKKKNNTRFKKVNNTYIGHKILISC